MTRGTKKVGIAGKYGPRYGVTIRKRIKEISKHRQRPARCPECMHKSVKRESFGIWKCRHCQLVFAAGAYSTRMRSFKKDESVSTMDKAYKEDYIESDEPMTEEPVVEEPASDGLIQSEEASDGLIPSEEASIGDERMEDASVGDEQMEEDMKTPDEPDLRMPDEPDIDASADEEEPDVAEEA